MKFSLEVTTHFHQYFLPILNENSVDFNKILKSKSNINTEAVENTEYPQMSAHSFPHMQGYPYQPPKAFVPPPKKTVEYQPVFSPLPVEVLYSEANDGEITIEVEPTSGLRKLVTAIDISSLYKEKRNKAIQLAK